MSISQVFQVATHFKFEVGAALLGASSLEKNVNRLSSAADDALISFQKLGVGINVSMGLGSGGAVGLIQKAIQSSEKFLDLQLKMSNVFASNKDKFTGPVDDFNQRMLASEGILKRIAGEAKKFALPEQEFASTVALLGAQLSSKGLSGTNMGNAVDLSRNFLKSAPALGIQPGQASGQINDIIGGHASKSQRLFQRLTGETTAFAEFADSSAKFNKLKPHKRLELLIKGLEQYSKVNGELLRRTEMLSSRLRVMRNVISGLDGVIKPLGDVLAPLFGKFVNDMTNIIDTDIRTVFANASKTIKFLVPDMQSLIVNLLQLREAATDTKKAVKTLGILGMAALILQFVSFMRLLSLIGVSFNMLISGLMFILKPLQLIRIAFLGMGFILSKVLVPFMALLAVFQLISRARAHAKVADTKDVPAQAARFSAVGSRFAKAFSNIFSPLTSFIDMIAKFISPLFQSATWMKVVNSVLEAMVGLFEDLGTVMLLANAGFDALILSMMKIVENLMNGKIFSLTDGVSDSFNASMELFFARNANKFTRGDKDPALSQPQVNIGKVEINNKFKENMEPDRIAFALVKQLGKASQAPTGESKSGNFAKQGKLSQAFGGGAN